MSHDIYPEEGGIASISAYLPDSVTSFTDVTVTLLELSNELNGITEPPVATVDTYTSLDDDGYVEIEDYRSFYVALEQHATPEHLEAVIRAIGRHAGESNISTLHAFLPRAIGNVTLNLLTTPLVTADGLKSQLQERVGLTLLTIQEAINGDRPPIAKVNLVDLAYDNRQSEGEIQFSVEILPDTSIDQVAQAAQTTLDHIEHVKAQS